MFPEWLRQVDLWKDHVGPRGLPRAPRARQHNRVSSGFFAELNSEGMRCVGGGGDELSQEAR